MAEVAAPFQVEQYSKTVYTFAEDLGGGVSLDMVLIPPGEFTMGSPPDEPEHNDSEGPQHQVTIAQPFFMGQYPVTQAQWERVASMPQVKRAIDPQPSGFKGENRPVEQVSWLDAEELCLRLSQQTQRSYRLPSEAEWEYACRAGTSTPFHFGETIDASLANYCAQDKYGDSGKYGRGQLGRRSPANNPRR